MDARLVAGILVCVTAACGKPMSPQSPATTGAAATAEQGGEASGIEAESQPPTPGEQTPPINGRITNVRIVGPDAIVSIDKGKVDGVGARGWTGYVLTAEGAKLPNSDFTLFSVEERTSSAKLQATMEDLGPTPQVVLQPPVGP